MKCHLVFESRSGKLSHVEYIVKKVDEVIGIPGEILFLGRIRASRKLVPDVVRATARRCDHVFE